jgi:hypothetical protein
MALKHFTLTAAVALCVPTALTAQATNAQAAGQAAASQSPSQPSDTQAPAAAKAQADTNAQAGSQKAATKADVKAGASVYDTSGSSVGKIESVDASGAVLNTGKVKAKIPVSSIAKGDKGLVISMSKDQIEAAAKAKSPK